MKARDFLLQSQGEDGKWTDYNLPVGASDQWVTGYAGLALACLGAAQGDEQAVSSASRALAWLQRERCYPEGWGFNGTTGPDTDSTAHVLLLMDVLGETMDPQGLDWLEHNWVDSGGYSTYKNEDAWGGAHPCVTPVVYLALHLAGRTERREEVEAYLSRIRREDGGWNSYWWKSHHYATWVTHRLLRFWGESQVNFGRDVDSNHARTIEFSTYHELASALGSEILEFGPGDGGQQLSQALAEGQLDDGSWPPGHDLRVTAQDCTEPWSDPRGETYGDHGRILTTATCVSVYALILQLGGFK